MNPFRYSGPVSAGEVINRESELKQLLSTAESANNSRLLAPREYGKTSLLNKLTRDASRAGWATVYVDFFGVITLADVAARIEAAYQGQLQGDLAAWFETMRRRFSSLKLGGGPVSVDVDLTPGEKPLLDRLDTPRRLLESRGVRTLVIFDEFQDVLETRGDADEVIRSAIQHHGEAASYVFAGSELGVMRELFGDRRRAFFRQASRVDLAPLEGADLAEYVLDRFRAGGKSIDAEALSALLDLVEGHPRSAMLLAHELWELGVSKRAVGLEEFGQAERGALEKAAADLRGMWRGLTRSDHELLSRLANGEAPYFRGRGGSQGGTIKAALARLEDAGEIVSTSGGYRIVDPLLAELIRRGWQP